MANTAHRKTSAQTAVDEDLQKQTIKRFLWLKSNFSYCLIISALLWVVAICYYIQNFIGWSSVTALSPTDFGAFVITLVVPLFLLWFVLAYIERSSSLDANAQLFQTYINSLMYPDEDASQNAKAIAAVLQSQAKDLQKENREILAQSAIIKNDLEEKISEFSDILKLLDTYSAKTLTELNDGVKELANRCTYITDKTSNATTHLKQSSADIAHSSDKFLGKLMPIVDEISALSSNIKGNITDNKAYLLTMKTQLDSCADLSQQYVRDMLTKTEENTKRIEQSFYKTAEEFDSLYKRLDISVSSIEGRIGEQRRLIQTQTQVINHNSDLINNKLSKYGKTVSDEIDKLVKNSIELEKMTKKQISTLKAVNRETGAAIGGIGDIFDEKRLEIERRCDNAVSSMQNVIVAINKETEKLMSFTNLTQAKNHDLQSIAETIVDKIGDISNKLALKTDTLKEKAVEVIDKFTQASEIISRSTDKINTSSNLVVNNSKEGVKLMEEQSFYISNALSNMDIVKDKLDKLRKEITKASTEITKSLSTYEQQLDSVNVPQRVLAKVDPLEPDFDRDKLIGLAKSLNRALRNMGVNAEKMFEKQDLFDLWDQYLGGNQSAFTDVLTRNLSHRLTLAIRKAFDDNAEFHNQVIRYLFLVDIIIKEMFNPQGNSRDELINLSVNMSLDKIYFVLVKALNSAD